MAVEKNREYLIVYPRLTHILTVLGHFECAGLLSYVPAWLLGNDASSLVGVLFDERNLANWGEKSTGNWVGFPGVLTEVKGELEIIKILLFNSSHSCLLWIEQIEDSIRNGIAKNAQNPKKPFRDDNNSFNQHDEGRKEQGARRETQKKNIRQGA